MSLYHDTQEVVDDIFDCDISKYNKVRIIIDRINFLIARHLKAQQDSPSDTIPSLALLQKHANPLLVKLLAKPPCDADETTFLDEISGLISSLCGRIASGETVTEFEFECGSIRLKETSYTEAEIGFQTWGGSILMAKMIDEEEIIVHGKNVLELGAGTGLAGLVCGLKSATRVVVSDYQKVVLENLIHNIKLNELAENVQCLKLDWRSCVGVLEPDADGQYSRHGDQDLGQAPTNELIYQQQKEEFLCSQNDRMILDDTCWDLVIAADCIFDSSHSEMIPRVARKYLSRDVNARFYVLLPHRVKFRREIDLFERKMMEYGWILEESHWIEKHTLTFRNYVYKLCHEYLKIK